MQPENWTDPNREISDFLWGDVGKGAAPNTERDEIAGYFTRVFGSDDGQVVLEYLVCITCGDSLSMNTSDHVLRHMQGQRSLVHHMIQLMEHGKQAPVKTPLREIIMKIYMKAKGVFKNEYAK